MTPLWSARFWPFLNKALKTCGAAKTLADVTVAREEIHPAETAVSPAVTMLPDDWDNITAIQHETSEAAERKRVAGGLREHKATERLRFHNVLATPRGCYTFGKSFNQHGRIALRELLSGPIERYEKGFYALPVIGMKYFGHWLTDALPTALLAQEDEALYLPDTPDWPHSRAYLDLLGWEPVPGPLAFFEEMSLSVDIGQNADRRARLCRIRDRIAATIPASAAPGVFIRRGHSGVRRKLLNEDEIANYFAAQGFNICTPTDSLETILGACCGVRTVVSVEGSHISHAILSAQPGALVVTLNPADRFNNVWADYMTGADLRMATLVISQGPDGYYADLDRLRQLIALASR